MNKNIAYAGLFVFAIIGLWLSGFQENKGVSSTPLQPVNNAIQARPKPPALADQNRTEQNRYL